MRSGCAIIFAQACAPGTPSLGSGATKAQNNAVTERTHALLRFINSEAKETSK
jgi:hypothetical protein